MLTDLVIVLLDELSGSDTSALSENFAENVVNVAPIFVSSFKGALIKGTDLNERGTPYSRHVVTLDGVTCYRPSVTSLVALPSMYLVKSSEPRTIP